MSKRSAALFVLSLLVAACSSSQHRVFDVSAAAPAPTLQAERPLILEASQGEVRAWRPVVGLPESFNKFSYFKIKIDRQHGGSPDFWFATEQMLPGAVIQPHRHLHEDEILYIGSGVAHVRVGSVEGDAHAGGIVFIPRNTWVTVKNTGKTPIDLLFGFNAPGFDRFLRCESTPLGQRVQPLNARQDQFCMRLGDVQYR